VEVNGKSYDVRVSPKGAVETVSAGAPTPESAPASAPVPAAEARVIESPLAGNIVKINVGLGQRVASGDVVVVLEAMKMETEVRSPSAGSVTEIRIKEGDAVGLGAALLVLG
jgi:oxaloacetate decarboxylase alpha subunit